MELQALIRRASRSSGMGRSFGPAIEHGGVLVIPVAVVAGGGGGGITDQSEPPLPHAPPSGSGLGFGGFSIPLGVYEVRDGQTRFVPSFDLTLILLMVAGLARRVIRLRRARLERAG